MWTSINVKPLHVFKGKAVWFSRRNKINIFLWEISNNAEIIRSNMHYPNRSMRETSVSKKPARFHMKQ